MGMAFGPVRVAGWMAGWRFGPAVPGLAPGACMRKEGVARVISPASQASERQDAEASLRGVSSIKAPCASWGTVTWHTNWPQPGSSGVTFIPAVPGLAPGACMCAVPGLAPGACMREGSGVGFARVTSPASQASERQDAEASLRGVSAGQDARSERPARWHGQPRRTQDVASSAISPASQASERQDAEAGLRGVSAGQDARSERPARWHGQPRRTQVVASSAIEPASQASAGWIHFNRRPAARIRSLSTSSPDGRARCGAPPRRRGRSARCRWSR